MNQRTNGCLDIPAFRLSDFQFRMGFSFMPGGRLLLIGTCETGSRLAQARNLLQAWFQGFAKPPTCQVVTLQDVVKDSDLLDSIAMAWLVNEEANPPALLSVIADLQDRRIPALLSRPDTTKPSGTHYQSGVVILNLDDPQELILANLRTVWGQGDLIRELHQEIALMRAHQKGLCEQISKMDEELRMASLLQQEFLPRKLPSLHHIEARALYRPATYVSGDIYDFERLDEDHLGFFVADAVGHGVPAALLTVSIKRSLHTKEINPKLPGGYRIIPPGEALDRLNRELIGLQTGRIRTATAAYGVLNARTLQVQIARAGHPYPLLMSADGRITPLQPDGGMLGVFPNETYETMALTIEPTDRLLVYSDGFELAFKGPSSEGEQQLYMHELAAMNQGTLDEALQSMEKKLDQESGSLNQHDDLTALLIGYGISPGRRARDHRFATGLTRATA